MSKDKVETIEFNSMVEVLKRLSKITDSINDSRRRRDVRSLNEDLKSYYYEILPDLTPGEEKACKDLLKNMKNHLRSPSGLIESKRNILLDKSEELEEVLRKAAKAHGYLTKNIKTDIVRAL